MSKGRTLSTRTLRNLHDSSASSRVTTRLFSDAFWRWVEPEGIHLVTDVWHQGMFERWTIMCRMKDGAPSCEKTKKGLTFTTITLDVIADDLITREQELIWND